MLVDSQRLYTNQSVLEHVVHKLFPAENILSNARKTSTIKDDTNWPLEIDLWVKRLHICFEFQDSYHYATTWYSQVPFESIRQKDYIKQHLLQEKEETLVVVPFWWQGDVESLAATIVFQRPDIDLPHSGACIPLNPLCEDIEVANIPLVGGIMLASFPPHFVDFKRTISSSDPWWLGEKYDGVRFCWHPLSQILYTRRGNEITMPSPFYKHFGSSQPLDGEIWFGYNRFSKAQQIIHAEIGAIEWSLFRGIVFDCPEKLAQHLPFEKRFGKLLCTVENHPFLLVASRTLCTSKKFLLSAIKNINQNRGEGVILRKPGSPYVSGRSFFLFKLKASMMDIEGLVVSIDGSLATIQLPNGTYFTGHIQKTKLKIKPGNIVVLAHIRNAKHLVHSNPKIIKIRKDITWQEVVQNWRNNVYYLDFAVPSKKALQASRSTTVARIPEKLQDFVKVISRKYSFDPGIYENWLFYHVYQALVGEFSQIVVPYGSISKLLAVLFPDAGNAKPPLFFLQKYRKLFFINFALSNQFDPCISANWYQVSLQQILSYQYGNIVLSYHHNKLDNALLSLFPNIGLTKTQFIFLNYSSSKIKNQEILLGYAKTNNFDASVPSNWYDVKLHELGDIMTKQFLNFHRGNVAKAILDLFPNIGLQIHKFKFFAMNYWSDVNNQKEFFRNFAKENKFDHAIAENWYSVSTQQIRSQKSASSVLRYYNGNFKKALLSLFPDLGLDTSKFLRSYTK
eukprot:Phypoly_transcript_03590.p1 GENE.Phypoly_transcript_03590~~Phypoly_transcript_03590.p1  ORF type:complete len:736 (+),score=72.25 Phypoly_transcript_03590:158-2365(+)